MTIEIKPGYDTDKVITYPSKGNEAFAYHQSKLNIHFELTNEDQKGVIINNGYVRDGDNLIYTHELSLEDALLSKPIQVRTLDGRNINLSLDETITPQTTHVIPGEGMPRKTNSKERGDLKIRFNIKFPLNLAVANKEAIIDVLK